MPLGVSRDCLSDQLHLLTQSESTTEKDKKKKEEKKE